MNNGLTSEELQTVKELRTKANFIQISYLVQDFMDEFIKRKEMMSK